MIIYLIIGLFIISFIAAFISLILKAVINGLSPPPLETMECDLEEVTITERKENYDRQIDGYTQLIKILDIAYLDETDTKKKAVILSKQLATLEKLNKTIEKREKLE